MFELAVVGALILSIMALVRIQDASTELKALRVRLDELEGLRQQRSDTAGSGAPAGKDSESAGSPALPSESGVVPVPESPSAEAGPATKPETSPRQGPTGEATPDEVQDVETAREKHAARPLAPLPVSMQRTEPARIIRGEDDDPLPVVGRTAGRGAEFETGGATGDAPGSASESIGFEARFGSTWLLRIGLVFLVIAAALFGIVVTPRIGPLGKVGMGYVFSALVFGAGLISHRLRAFARPVMAGGLSIAFLVSYAAYFIEPMRCAHPGVSLFLMSVFILAILFFADQWRSEFTGGLAVFLGHVGTFVAARNLESIAPSSLIAVVFLSAAAVVLLLRRSWIILSLFAVVAAYASHLLWTTLAGEAATPRQALYVNLAFLTSYYTMFAVSDLLWWRRRSMPVIPQGESSTETTETGIDKPTLGLALGPLNLVLYTSIASLAFLTTRVDLGHIHFFYFALALVQFALALIHRNYSDRNFLFYPAAATVLLTLGFFSAFESLALNLVLAAEAMVLLIIAHQTRLRLFHLLSQAALLANFLHYWVYASDADPTRARFIGGMLTAGVYLMKSVLEEVWYGRGSTFEWIRIQPRSPFLREFSDAFDRLYGLLTPILAHAHAVAGALVLVDQCRRFLDPIGLGVVLASGTVAFTLLGAWRRSVPMLMVATFVYAGLLSIITSASNRGEIPPGAMAIFKASASFAVAGGMTVPSVQSGRHPFRLGLCLWPGLTLLFFLLSFRPASLGDPEISVAFGIVFAAMMAALLAVERFSAVSRHDYRAKKTTRWLYTGGEIAVGLVIAGQLFQLFLWKFEATPLRFVLIAGLGSVLPLIALVRRTTGIYAAGAMLMTLLMIGLLESSTDRSLLFASLPAAIATGLPLIAVAWVQDLLVRLFEEQLTGRRRLLADLVIAPPYAYGLLLLYGLAEFRLDAPWHFAAWAALSAGLMGITQPWRLARGGAVAAFFFSFVALVFVIHHSGKRPQEWNYVWAALSIIVTGFVEERLWTFGEASMKNRRRPLIGAMRLDLSSVGRLVVLLPATAVALSSGWNSTLIGPRWTTAAWAIYAALVMIMGFVYRRASFRRIALGVLALCTARVLVVDIRNLETIYQAFALLVLGLCLVAIAWLYSRFSSQLRRWL